ncbi:MAG TPA: PEGA domain-containing protein [Haliangiales bacterium]|nr:PEGA domain-containing protein [Haliangiales bacterium]
MDVRPADADLAPRRALAAALAERREIALVEDADLAAALAGEPDGAARAAAEQAVARAEAAACPGAAGEATRAVALTAQAYDPDAGAATYARALAVELRCADAAGDRAAAQRAAARMRALGGDVGALADRYPHIDASSNVVRQPLQVTTDPPGARVFIDDALAGVSPVERMVAPGPHQVSASAPGRARASLAIEVKEGRAASASLALAEEKPGPYAPLRARVRGWRQGDAIAAPGVALALREAGVGVAVVWNGARAQIWRLDDRGGAAPLEEVAPAEPAAVAAAAARHAGGGAPAAPAEPDKKGRTWWLYALALGAVGAALGAVLLTENGGKTQSIEVKWP